jgi:hypothetical protein
MTPEELAAIQRQIELLNLSLWVNSLIGFVMILSLWGYTWWLEKGVRMSLEWHLENEKRK